MKRDDDQELWDLLGRTAEPKISPFFARNVLREIRQPGNRGAFVGWFSLRRLIPAAGMATLIAAVFLRMHASVSPLAAPSSPDMLANADAQDYEVMADLDDLLASDDNSLEESVLL